MQVNRPRIMMKAQMTSSSSFFSLNKSTGAVHVTCQRIKRYAAYQYLQSVERTREGSPGKEKRRAGDLPAAVQMSGSEVADREAGWGRPCGHVDGSISLFTVCNLVMRVIGEGGCLGIHSQALLVFRCLPLAVAGRRARAMLQDDARGWSHRLLELGQDSSAPPAGV